MNDRMHVGVTLHSYMVDIKFHLMTPRQSIEHAASVGAECIELVDSQFFLDWPHPKLTTIYETRDLIHSLGMTLCCFSQYTNNEFSIDHQCTDTDKIQQIKESILYAHILETPIVRIGPLETLEPIWDIIIQECLPFAARYNVKLGIEIHSPMNPERAIGLVEQSQSDHLGLVPDFSAWWNKGNISLNTFEACLPYTIHVHAKAQQIAHNGEVLGIPFSDLMQILKDAKYTGTIVAEFEPLVDTDEDTTEGSSRDLSDDRRPMALFTGREAVEILVPYMKRFA